MTSKLTGDYYIIIAVNTDVDGYAGGRGHAWAGVINNKTTNTSQTVVARGIGPKTGVSSKNPTAPAKKYDNTDTKFVYACAYKVTKEQYKAAHKKMYEAKTADYNMYTHNCTTWALSVLEAGGIELTVGQDQRPLGDLSCLAEANPPPFYSPGSLYKSLSEGPGVGATKCFGKRMGTSKK